MRIQAGNDGDGRTAGTSSLTQGEPASSSPEHREGRTDTWPWRLLSRASDSTDPLMYRQAAIRRVMHAGRFRRRANPVLAQQLPETRPTNSS